MERLTNISVIIPTYNGTRFIREALESVFAQTLLPDEIIVVDDASTDGTPELIEEIAKASPVPLKLIRCEKNSGGPSKPLNIGIRKTTCHYIAVLEQDDIMLPSRIEKLYHALENDSSASVAIGRVRTIDSTSGCEISLWREGVDQMDGIVDQNKTAEQSFFLPCDAACSILFYRNFAATNSNLFFTKDMWHRVGEFSLDVRTCSDLDFMFKLATAGGVVIVTDILLDYRVGADSLHRRDADSSFLEMLLIRLKWASHFRWSHPNEYSEMSWKARKALPRYLRQRRFLSAITLFRYLLQYGHLCRYGIAKFRSIFLHPTS